LNKRQQDPKTVVRQDNPDDAGFAAPAGVPARTLVTKDNPDDVPSEEKKARPRD